MNMINKDGTKRCVGGDDGTHHSAWTHKTPPRVARALETVAKKTACAQLVEDAPARARWKRRASVPPLPHWTNNSNQPGNAGGRSGNGERASKKVSSRPRQAIREWTAVSESPGC